MVSNMNGLSVSPYIQIKWQQGVLSSKIENGCRPEDVIEEVINRLLVFQAGPLACTENEIALAHLRSAVNALNDRTQRRNAQGVAHTASQHVTERTEDNEDDFSATGA